MPLGLHLCEYRILLLIMMLIQRYKSVCTIYLYCIGRLNINLSNAPWKFLTLKLIKAFRWMTCWVHSKTSKLGHAQLTKNTYVFPYIMRKSQLLLYIDNKKVRTLALTTKSKLRVLCSNSVNRRCVNRSQGWSSSKWSDNANDNAQRELWAVEEGRHRRKELKIRPHGPPVASA